VGKKERKKDSYSSFPSKRKERRRKFAHLPLIVRGKEHVHSHYNISPTFEKKDRKVPLLSACREGGEKKKE